MTDFTACIDDAHGHTTDVEREDCMLRTISEMVKDKTSGARERTRAWKVEHGMGRIGDVTPVRLLNSLADLGQAESPPERMFLDALNGASQCVAAPGVEIVPQCKINTPVAQFRADVGLTLRVLPAARLAVEVDGWAFHDGDRERAAYDKRRDRAILRAGWRTVRFAASEVTRDARMCAIETIETLLAVAYRPPQERA